jgi:hypothetical protein
MGDRAARTLKERVAVAEKAKCLRALRLVKKAAETEGTEHPGRSSRRRPVVLSGSPADFGRLIAGETEKWAKVIKFAKIKVE